MAEADLLDEPLPRVRLLQEVRQPPRVPADPEPARFLLSLKLNNEGFESCFIWEKMSLVIQIAPFCLPPPARAPVSKRLGSSAAASASATAVETGGDWRDLQ